MLPLGQLNLQLDQQLLQPIEKEAETPDIKTLASASTASDPTLNDAETPDGSTTAEPRTDTEPTLDENSTPLISKLGLKPIDCKLTPSTLAVSIITPAFYTHA